jgi:hypothetical protein
METRRCLRGLAAVLLASAFATAGCGEDGGNETVFLYFINGYPGTASVDVIGPTGIFVSGAGFGDRRGETGISGQDDGVCPDDAGCVPIEFDRSLGVDFTFLLEGMPEQTELQKDLYSMYPHETATMVLTRRSNETGIDTTLLRHTQTISSDCTLTLVNGLSVSNEFVANSYSIAPEFKIEPIDNAGFVDEEQIAFRTECGPLPTDHDRHRELARSDLRQRVQENPWFYPVQCTDSQLNNVFCYAWGTPRVDNRSRLYEGGQVVSVLNSEEYFECVEAAISIKQPEDEMNPLPFPPEDAQVQCPEGDITWADVDVDFQAVQSCRETLVKTADTLAPASQDTFQAYQGPEFCDVEFRVRNEGQDLIFGPKGDDAFGQHQDGKLVSSNIETPAGSQHFWVLLGRPVNPIIWQWNSGESFVDFNDPETGFPYPNDGNDLIGDYNDK